jgi:hypothetical protein
MLPRIALCSCLAIAAPSLLGAQAWGADAAEALVARGIAQRAVRQADSTLRDFRVRAHGFVFFLGQLAEGLREPPRLVKSDQLVLEVYWKAPDRSKQQIVGWRDRADLPTDIQYHRDHLGIVQNNFADRIRLGEGDEVRDVPHPLARDGPELYEYGLVDSTLSIALPDRTVRVYEVAVRPRDFGQPRVVGRLYFDVETADVVIFSFSFTRSAYLDDTIEDITIVLENGLWNERYWLPNRQEIEIRRRTKWLDLPARGIIRGRWEIEDYEFNVGLPDALFGGMEIVAAPRAVRDSFVWDEPLHAAIQASAGPVMTVDLEEVRGQITESAGAAAMSGLASARLGVGSISDVAHFNRVEGLALGLGTVLRSGGKATEAELWAGVGLSDERFKGRIATSHRVGAVTLQVRGAREIRDFGDERVISPLLNSVLAQELGRDFGDYVLEHAAFAGVRRDFGVHGGLGVEAGVEHTESVAVTANPASGTFRSNPALGAGTLGIGRITVERRSAVLAVRSGLSGAVTVEGGTGEDRRYLRVDARGRAHVTFGATRLVGRASGGWGSSELPAHRTFALGGRGTLVGEEFRRWGGRYAAHGSIEWQLPVPVPAIPLGSLANTGREAILAPFVALGWAGGAVPGLPWQPSDGVRPVAGVALEWFHRFFRVDFGIGLRDGTASVVVDVTQDLWDIL